MEQLSDISCAAYRQVDCDMSTDALRSVFRHQC